MPRKFNQNTKFIVIHGPEEKNSTKISMLKKIANKMNKKKTEYTHF